MERKGIIDGQTIVANVCTAEVDSLDDYVKKVEDNDGQIVLP